MKTLRRRECSCSERDGPTRLAVSDEQQDVVGAAVLLDDADCLADNRPERRRACRK